MLDVHLDDRAQRFVDRLPPKHAGQVADKIFDLRINPLPRDSKLLKDSEYRRADSGEYRIVYRIIGNLLYVRLVGKRNDSDVYKRLKRLR